MDTTPVRLGIVGIGRAFWCMHSEELKSREDKFKIVAACDVMEERLKQMADRYGCGTYTTLEGMLADPDVEVVNIATRTCDHFKHCKQALEAGKAVFLEKPMSTCYEEAKTLVDISRATGTPLYVRHNRRFEPAFMQIHDILSSGVLGDVFEVKLRRLMYQRREDWQTLKEFGGGQLLNWGPHIVDHALQFLASPVESMWSDLKRVAAVGDAEDHVRIILKGTNGRTVDLEISGGAALDEALYLIYGTRGALSCDDRTLHMRYLDPDQPLSERSVRAETPAHGEFVTADNLKWIEESIPALDSHLPEPIIWDHLYRTVREGAAFPISLDQALEVMRVISLARVGTPFE